MLSFIHKYIIDLNGGNILISYKLSKLLDIKLEDGTTIDLSINEDLSILEKTSEFSITDQIINLTKSEKLKTNFKYKYDFLYAYTENNEKITLYDVSFSISFFIDDFGEFIFCTNYFFVGAFIENILEYKISKLKIEIEDTYPSIFEQIKDFSFTGNGVHVYYKKIYDYLDTESPFAYFKQMGIEKLYENRCYIVLSATKNKKFNELRNLLFYLCDYLFLILSDYPEFNNFILEFDNQQYMLYAFGNKYLRKNRKSYLPRNTYNLSLINTFNNWCKFRSNSGIIFDIFKQTVYSNSFEEDYPLRFTQCLEGLMIFLKHSTKKTNLVDTLEKAITLTDYNLYPFSTDVRNIFIKKTKNHRHLFSHAKYKGQKLEGEENKEVAIALYDIIRKLIVMRISEGK